MTIPFAILRGGGAESKILQTTLPYFNILLNRGVAKFCGLLIGGIAK